jgi:hypothetical protein
MHIKGQVTHWTLKKNLGKERRPLTRQILAQNMDQHVQQDHINSMHPQGPNREAQKAITCEN